MRWPLKHQILLPMAGLLLVTIGAVSVTDAWISGRRAQRQIEQELSEIAETLLDANFPLTDQVLKQMAGLSGAAYIVTSQTGQVVARSHSESLTATLPATLPVAPTPSPSARLSLDQRLEWQGEPFLHVALPLRRDVSRGQPGWLHILYPQTRYTMAWRDAVWPPTFVGLTAMGVVVLVSRSVANRVTRPIGVLQRQVDEISRGQFAPMDLPSRDDELRDLAGAVNHMAELLAQYEDDVRRNEQLRTLGRLGGGIAHQLRNAVTGCQMAVDLHRRACPNSGDDALEVAGRQLKLTDEYLRRFLSLGKGGDLPRTRVDLRDVVEDILPLVRPKAGHLRVTLQWTRPAESLVVVADRDGIGQVIANLLLNAVEAAAEHAATAPAADTDAGRLAPRVRIQIARGGPSERVVLSVLDSGRGPSQTLHDQLFEPLVSEKRDGVGLGLSVAREIVGQHNGSLGWHRQADWTCFTMELPMASEETALCEPC